MKKVVLSLLIIFILCGCSKKNNEAENKSLIDSSSLSEIKELINNNTKKIEELSKKNEELEQKIVKLEEEIENLKTNSETKHTELENLAKQKANYTSNNNAIGKGDLIGTWKNSSYNWTFNSDGTVYIGDNVRNYYLDGNWIIVGESALYYEYKNGKLYTTDDGVVLSK